MQSGNFNIDIGTNAVPYIFDMWYKHITKKIYNRRNVNYL